MLPEKIHLGKEYVATSSLFLDMAIIVKTVLAILFDRVSSHADDCRNLGH